MQQLTQWHDRHRPASTFNDLLKKLNSAGVPRNPPGNWEILEMLEAESQILSACCVTESLCWQKQPARGSFVSFLRWHYPDPWREACGESSGHEASALLNLGCSSPVDPKFLRVHHRARLCTAIVLQTSPTSSLHLAGAAALCRPSLLLTEALRGVAETGSLPKLHPEPVEHVLDQQKWFY